MYEYLQAEDVIVIHEYAIKRYGGLPGLNPKEGMHCVKAKCYLPQQSFSGEDPYPTIAEKAAVYMYYFTIGHCFLDGNKRIGYLTASTFLNLNGYEIVVSDEELYRMSMSIGNDKARASLEEVVHWMKKYMKKIA